MKIKSLLLGILLACVTSCHTDLNYEDNSNRVVEFSASAMDEIDTLLTRGTPITSLAAVPNIGVFAFTTGSNTWENTSNSATPNLMYNVPVEQSNNKWTYSSQVLWPKSNVTFFAYSPHTSGTNGLTASESSKTGVPYITYTVPTTCKDQPDLMVGGMVANRNGGGHVSFNLKHALSYVSFAVKGSPSDVITKIAIKNAYIQGDLQLDYTNTVVWNNLVRTPSTTFEAGIPAGLTASVNGTNATNVDGYLMMIPQTLTGNNVILAATVNGVERTMILTGTWQAGKGYNYNINLSYTVSFDANGGSGSVGSISTSAGNPITIPSGFGLTSPSTGMSFAGWATTQNASVATFKAGDSYIPTGNTTLYAVWIKEFYDITNGGITVKWAPGNLVANGTNGARVGSATDGGLYFQFGSLYGWSGLQTNDGASIVTTSSTNSLSLQVYPSGGIPNATWSTVPRYTKQYDVEMPLPMSYDPCRKYLGSTWRLPFINEIKALFNNSSGPLNTTSTGGWTRVTSPVVGMQHSSGMFIPASGMRSSTNGNPQIPGAGTYLWGGTDPGGNMYGTGLIVGSDSWVTFAYNNIWRQQALPVRCVLGSIYTVSYDVNGGGGTVPALDSVNIPNFTYVPGIGNMTPPAGKTTLLGWSTSSSATVPTHVPGMPYTPNSNTTLYAVWGVDYITVTNGGMTVNWAVGNLVATTGGCKIGEPSAPGLYFQFGSTYAWSGANNNNGTGVLETPYSNPLSLMRPTGVSTPGWGSVPKWTVVNNSTVPASFDPCTTYLGSAWRLPTVTECKALFNNTTNGAYSSTGGWSYVAYPPAGAKHTSGLFIPGTGARYYTNGGFNSMSSRDGNYWSGSYTTIGTGMLITNTSASGNMTNSSLTYGYAIRCVRP